MFVKFLFRKALILLASLFFIITATFFLMKAIPGDPLSEEQGIPHEIHENLCKHYGLNDPLLKQYGKYLRSILIWDFGPSFTMRDVTINDIIKEGFPVSATLGLEALLLSLSAGIILGTIAALWRNRWQDYAAMTIAVLGISVPSFVIATITQYFLALKMNVFPVARWGTIMHTILPALSLAALPTAFIARLTRTKMIEVLQQDYIKTAKMKGLSQVHIIMKHVLRNTMLPIVAYLGQLSANILVGSFVIERIFGIPGLGQWMITSISNRDYTVIMGMTIFCSIILLSTIFITDIAYGLLDPRIKEEAP